MAMFHRLVALLALAGALQLGAVRAAPSQPAAPSGAVDATADTAAAASKAASSECGKQCFAAAARVGFSKLAANALACFTPYKGKRLGHADCCDKAELLFGARGPLANCFCCTEFAKAMLSAVPFAKLDTTPKEFLEKMNLCRVPLIRTPACSPRQAKEGLLLPHGRASPPPGPYRSRHNVSLPAAGNATLLDHFPSGTVLPQISYKGALDAFGFLAEWSPDSLAAQGAAAVGAGVVERVVVVGGSRYYSDYVTGFIQHAEEVLPPYPTPPMPRLPPLPARFREDVAWVANLRRGPYPDLVLGRPARFSPKVMDPLQNGQVASMSPAVVFGGSAPWLQAPGGGPTN